MNAGNIYWCDQIVYVPLFDMDFDELPWAGAPLPEAELTEAVY